jgi:hypothetical protein
MLRATLLLCLLLAFLSALSCQSHTEVLNQGQDRAGETVAISTLQQVAKAQVAYSVSNEGNFGSFEQLTTGGYLDSRFNSSKPVIHGYALSMTTKDRSGVSEASFTCNADPVGGGNGSGRHFYIDSTSSQVRANAGAVASANDPAVF